MVSFKLLLHSVKLYCSLYIVYYCCVFLVDAKSHKKHRQLSTETPTTTSAAADKNTTRLASLVQTFLNGIEAARHRVNLTAGKPKCRANNCSYCVSLRPLTSALDITGCLNASYVPEKKGLNLAVTLNQAVLYQKLLTDKSPPPLCFDLNKPARNFKICLTLRNVNYKLSKFGFSPILSVGSNNKTIFERDLGSLEIDIASRVRALSL